MLSLSRGGPTMWMSRMPTRQDRSARQRLGRSRQPQRCGGLPGGGQPPDARGRGLRLPRPGPHHRRAAHRDDRNPGGIHNPLTRLLIKPSHLAGYAQNAYAFNYLGRPETSVTR